MAALSRCATAAAEHAIARRRRTLAFVALATFGALTVWFSTNAVSAALGEELGFSNADVAWLTIAVQLGFVAGDLPPVFVPLPKLEPGGVRAVPA